MNGRPGGASLLVLALLVASCWRPFAAQAPRTVLFVVLDTVRSQNTSICGYERPTTPVLEMFLQGRSSLSCGAVAPSSWTLPSHASFFTGVEQPEHRAGAGPGTVEFSWGTANGLGTELPTLAERFRDRDYRTVLVSGNPFVSDMAGLTRGFDVERVAESFPGFFDDGFVEALRDTLERHVEPGPPLFLFLNISDAHNPWTAVRDVGWLPPRAGASGGLERTLYESGELEAERSAALKAHVRDVYDFGIFRADRTLGRALALLHEGGWFDGDYRIVVTSDHGEFLGEHGRLLHGGPELFEEVVRVPLLVQDTAGAVDLPAVLSATSVFELVLNGRLPQPALPVRATTFSFRKLGQDDANRPCWNTTSALWAPGGKLVCSQGKMARFDLSTDPAETRSLAAAEHPDLAVFERFARRTEAAGHAVTAVDEELTEKLRAVGYLE